MFVIVATYRAKPGEEDAIIALHEDKMHTQAVEANRYHSWQLLRKMNEPREFISIAQFADERMAQEAMQGLQKDEWYGRLVSFMEENTSSIHYTVAWSLR